MATEGLTLSSRHSKYGHMADIRYEPKSLHLQKFGKRLVDSLCLNPWKGRHEIFNVLPLQEI